LLKLLKIIVKKTEIKKLDKAWSTRVKELANFRCEHCLEEDVWLNSCHMVGRRYRATRWDTQNGMCLCFVCHRQYDEHGPLEEDIKRRVIGEKHYEKIRQKAKGEVAKYQQYEEVLLHIQTSKKRGEIEDAQTKLERF